MSVSCPKCFKLTSEDRRIGDKYFCDCGWRFQVLNSDNKPPVHKDKSSLLICLFAGLLLFSFLHAVSWDSFFFKVIPVKIAYVTGMSDTKTIAELSHMCEVRKKYNCVLQTLDDLYKKNPLQQIESLHKKGKLLVKMENYKDAVKTYQLYFDKNGKSPEAHYQFAKSLRYEEMISEATAQYELALESKPDVLQVSVARSFVDMLIENKKYQQARKVITTYRKKAQHTKYFLEAELKQVNEALKGHRKISSL